ncbi:PEP-CTERM sorting domain-containing protein [Glaciimonas sp. CA11.2]|uniref:PEP-CTERM sorting domain-containing protein n=1 Tax=Glaciimonas sp. CA11.2 TaxID=3048601 RepID=UPI002AB4E47E|nr:PEP-CTERM sorting domain-containing protein [Glaciimonas sp. CA11.2]MDY7547767.1 PEP-CTERM sorting domain-containing protein [Glaciimonas sp. CA11.2]MEB0163391.1 PEP-CTERM sorting domain-containing protein [Glaciimonas sp. CA11.2]
MHVTVRLFLLSTIVAVTFAGTARADVLYTYTGNNFTSATAPYTTSDKVSGVLTFAQALGPNYSYQQVFPEAYSFTGGVTGDSITNYNHTSGGFYATTDGNGDIAGWYIGVEAGSAFLQSQHTLYDGAQFDHFSINNSQKGEVQNNEGHWTVAVPEPESIALLGLGLLGLIAARRKSKT